MTDILPLLRARRSVRKYSPRPLPRQTIAAILEAATYAPSGHNRQSWLFTAVTSPAVLHRLNQLIRDGFLSLELTDADPAELRDAKAKVQRLGARYCFSYGAPCLVIASNVAGYHNGMADCACAVENMLLAACGLGLGSCWVNQLHWLDRDPALRAYLESLHIPLTQTICASAVFGYPAEPLPGAAPRKEGTCQIIE